VTVPSDIVPYRLPKWWRAFMWLLVLLGLISFAATMFMKTGVVCENDPDHNRVVLLTDGKGNLLMGGGNLLTADNKADWSLLTVGGFYVPLPPKLHELIAQVGLTPPACE
jgi:hypothetical protein